MTQYLITSALPYVNNVPHLGNLIGSTLSADFYARYCRNVGRRVLFVCGSDCYGTASEIKAKANKTSPEKLCAEYHILHKQIYDWFGIKFDIYGKTTTDTHSVIVKDISKMVDQNDYLHTETTEQLYCASCEIFLADRYVIGTCPFCGKSAKGDQCDASDCGKLLQATRLISPKCVPCGGDNLIIKSSKHLFYDLNKSQMQLEQFAKQTIMTSNANSITTAWLTKGLKARCITRDLKWGVNVPNLCGQDWPEKVFYVWYDAPLGYISITANERSDWKEWWQNPDTTKLYQFMAKDNVPFHTVMFPAVLYSTGQNWTMATNICATEYLNYQGEKFSKSAGIGIFGDKVIKMGIPADYWRYYLATIRPEKSDSNFDLKQFKAVVNDLADKFGNLVNRLLALIKKSSDGYPKVFTSTMTVADVAFNNNIDKIVSEYNDSFNAVKIIAAVHHAMQLSQETNRYLFERAPWLIKDDPDQKNTVCGFALMGVFKSSVALSPIIPSIHDKFCFYLGLGPGELVLDLTKVHINDFEPLINKNCMEKLL